MKRLPAAMLLCICILHIVFFMTALTPFPDAPALSFFTDLAFVILLSVVLLLFYLAARRFLQEALESSRLEETEKQKKIAQEQSGEIKKHKEEVLSFQLSVKQSLGTFEAYLKNREYHLAASYIKEISQTFQNTRFRPVCSDNLLNAILESKRKKAESYKISVQYRILLPEDLSIPLPDISCILFNLLDNGIDACRSSRENAPFIRLFINTNADFLTIHMCNTKNPCAAFHSRTTKKDASRHGFGLSIMEEISSKYDGWCKWQDNGDSFDSLVFLRLQNTN